MSHIISSVAWSTCIAASAEDNTFPYSASSLPFLQLWPASSRELFEAFSFISSWLCEQFVFLIPPLCMVEDWHVVSHLSSPSMSTKEEPVFQQLLQTDSPTNLPKGMSLKAFQNKVLADVCFTKTFAKPACPFVALYWWIRHRHMHIVF